MNQIVNEIKFDKERFKLQIENIVKLSYVDNIRDANPEQVYQAVCTALKGEIIDAWIATRKKAKEQDAKMLYYLSMEFLMGRALGNDLINIGAYEDVKEILEEYGLDINLIEDQERDWALGNGGLGRLAACFLDSLATLGYQAYGCGVRYKYGMFRQKIENGVQKEVPDDWLRLGNQLEIRRDKHTKKVRFGGYVRWTMGENGEPRYIHEGYQTVLAVPYDMPVIGYKNGVIDTLRIWDAEPAVALELEAFGQGDYMGASRDEQLAENICKVLYPNDSHYAGKELRLKQQYFFISATLQRALERYMEDHDDIRNLHEKVCFQMNDTHPSMAVAELMRLLIDEYGLSWNEAWDVTTKTCAYTNHTIMAEASEQWPIDLFMRLLPRVYQIIDEINRRFVAEINERYPDCAEEKVEKLAILYDGRVRMANLAIRGSFSVNGVARLHTEILKKRELKAFYELTPEKFNNKTNGITQRRFMLHANPLLSDWITKRIGDGWITDLSELKKLVPYADDPESRREFAQIKRQNKIRLAKYIKEHNGIDVNVDSIFDVQVKRLHEYKRQLMNILHVMYIYQKLLDNPGMPYTPRTYIFGAKAAAGYRLAKLIIELINAVAKTINADERVNKKLKVVFIEDYCVSNAELIFAASDVSEQISTASKEASGTGNMKFMLNGALTLGTMDGANVEIVEEVGAENAIIFGMSSDEVMAHERNRDYDPMEIFRSDAELRGIIMQLINGRFRPDDPEHFRPLYDSLLNTNVTDRADTYFILKDFRAYAEAQQRSEYWYNNRDAWFRSAILNVACSGKFSSDRTITEYTEEIWHLDKLKP